MLSFSENFTENFFYKKCNVSGCFEIWHMHLKQEGSRIPKMGCLLTQKLRESENFEISKSQKFLKVDHFSRYDA